MSENQIQIAASTDGTKIAGRVQGQGEPLVLVHGGLGDGDVSWLFMLPFLVEQFTCYLMSTRGRGRSGDNADHSRERQFEDVAAFVQSIDEPVWVFGHSSGALWALGGAALAVAHVNGVALYESPLPAAEPLITNDQFERVSAAVNKGRLSEAAQITTSEIIGLHPDEQALFEAPGVADRVHAILPVALLEFPEVNRPLDVAVLERLTMPVLLLHGTRSRPHFTDATRHLAERLNDVRVVEIAGAGHIGPLTHAEAVAREMVDFFRG